MEYEVRITATQVFTVPVEALNMAEAKALAERNWNNREYEEASTHTRPRCDHVKYEALYPDYDRMQAQPIIIPGVRKVAERER